MNALELEGWLVPFGLVLTRIGAFVGTCPTFVADSVSPTVRALIAAMLSLVFVVSLGPCPMPPSLLLALVSELFIGAMLAASVRLTATAVGFAGELFDLNLGYSFARQMNPAMGEEATPIMHLAQWLASVLFLVAGGQHHVIAGLAKSLSLMPPGKGALPERWPALFAGHLSEVVQAGLLLAIPIVLTMLCTQLALALLSRLAPSLNIWAIGLLGTCGMGLLSLWCFLPAWIQAIVAFWRQMDPFAALLIDLKGPAR